MTGSPGRMFKGGEVMFRLALFDSLPVDSDNVGVFRNHANLATFLMKIRSGSYAGTLLMDSTSGATVTIKTTVTEQQFFDQQDAPISIYCPNAITAIAEGNQYMTFAGTTLDAPAQIDGLGRGRIAVEDIGLGLADSVTPTGPAAVSSDVVNALFALCVKFGLNPAGKTATFVSPNSTVGRTIGCDDEGQQLSVLETY